MNEKEFEALFKTSPIITRYPDPVLTKDDVPYDSSLTFNAGVIKHNGKYIMLFRNDYGATEEDYKEGRYFEGTNLGYAESEDGIHFKVSPEPAFELKNEEFSRAYDPRITYLDGRFYICFAADSEHGIRGGICVTDDFKNFEILHLSVPDNRNMVLFPEKIGGKYVRLERPMPVYSRGGKDRFDIWLSESPDLVYWGNSKLVLACEDVPFCNDKIGPAAPPLKTDKGWLCIFHSVDRDDSRGINGWEQWGWTKRYVIGIMLLDLEDPSKVIGMSKVPLMVPEGKHELEGGFRNNALFPCAMFEENGMVKIYYSAGDMVIRLAEAKLSDLLDICSEPR